MQDRRIEEERTEDHLSEPDRDSAVLDLMLCDTQSYPWTVEELVREEFVFPTRTARNPDRHRLTPRGAPRSSELGAPPWGTGPPTYQDHQVHHLHQVDILAQGA